MAALLLLIAVTLCIVPAVSSPPGMCATYGHCADFSPGHFTPIDCVNYTAAVRPSAPLPLCPHLSTVCCDERQYEEFAEGFLYLQNTLGFSCPACLHNFRTYLCAFSCSGNQSQFLSVNATRPVPGGNSTNGSAVVTAVNVAVSRSLMTRLFESCKDVVAPNTGLPVFGGDFSAVDVDSFMAAVLNSDQSPAHSFFSFSDDDDNALTINNVGDALFRCDDQTSNLTCTCSSCPTVCQRCPAPAAAPNDSSLLVDAAYPSFGHNFVSRIAYSCAMAFCCYVAVLLLAALAVQWSAGSGSDSQQLARRAKSRALVVAAAAVVLLVLLVYAVSAVWVDVTAAQDVTVGQEAGMVRLLASYFDPLFFTFLLVSLVLLLLGLSWLVYSYARAHPYAFHYDPALLHSASSFTTSTVRPSALLLRYSAFIASHPYLVIVAAVGITVLCGLGLLSARLESDPIALWVSPSSQVLEEKRYFDSTFGPFYRTEQLIITAAGGSNASVLNSSTLVFLSELTDTVRSLVVRYDAVSSSNGSGSSGEPFVTLEQLCYRPIVGGGCVVESALEWFNRSSIPLSSNSSVLREWVAYCATHAVADACRGSIGALTFPYVVLGGYSGSQYDTATALIVTFPLNNAPDSLGRAQVWELALIDLLSSEDVQQRVRSEGLQLDFMTERSVADEIARGTYKDVGIIALSYLLMFVYISAALSSGQWGSPAPSAPPSPYALVSCNVPLHTKVVLGLAALLIAVASLVISLGLVSAAGIALMPIIAEVIPFLVLAIGIDNVFLLSHSFRRQAAYLSLHSRLALTLSEVGIGITLAAASECGAFLLGASTDMPAVQAFAVISAVAIAVDWALQVTVFSAVLVLDARRMEQGRWDLCCCVQDEEVEQQVDAWKRSRTQGRGEEEEADYEAQIDAAHVQHQHPDGNAAASSSAADLSSPSGSTPPLPPFSSTSPFSSESYLQRFMRRYYLPFLFHPLVRLLVLLLFPLAFCWLLYYGLTHLQLGLDQSTVVPDDSYLKPYFASEAQFLNVGPPVFFVVRQPEAAAASPPSLSYNYSSLSFQDRICSNSASCDEQSLQNLILTAACTPDSYIAQSATSWLDTYLVWLSTADCCSFDPAAPGVLLPIGSASACFPGDPGCPVACFNNSADTAALFDRPDAAAFEQWMQPWLVNSTCGEQCAYCSAGLFDSIAFTTSPLANSSSPLVQTTVTASRYMSFHTPLRRQSDFIGAIGSAHALAARMAAEQQLQVFPYSVIYVYFQQFLDIEQVAVRSLCLALAAIFVLSLLLLRCFFISVLQVLTIGMMVGDLLGCCAVLGVDVNALSVLNLIMAVGISVEFCIHISARFLFTPAASRSLRAAHALYTVGSSVVEGITLTKVTGICVLAFASSAVFDIYYTRMYAAIVVLGAMHGLLWLPVLLSVAGSEQSRDATTGCCGGWMWGWPCAAAADKEEDEVEWEVEDEDEEEEEEEEEEVDDEGEEARVEAEDEDAKEEEEEEAVTDDEDERVQAAPAEPPRVSYVGLNEDWRQALLVEEQQASRPQRRLRPSNR